MEDRLLEAVPVSAQLEALEERVYDKRPGMRTPFPRVNEYLHRGAAHPGEFIILGGRKGTRKTCVALSWAASLLNDGVPVGFMTLDESLPMYAVKLMSAMSQLSAAYIEDNWEEEDVKGARARYDAWGPLLTMSRGTRPNLQSMQAWLEMASVHAETPRVVFCDYASLLEKGWGKENERVARLFEDLQVWTRDNDLVTVAIHQAGRTDEGRGRKYHGDTPMTPEGLLYGGEQQADIIFGTYRPALSYLGNLGRDMAENAMGDSWDEEKWQEARHRVAKYKSSTFLQLLKNRPSVRGEWPEGCELVSPNDSQYIEEKAVAA